MQFSIPKDIFLKALQKVQGIVETRKTMPILSNVLIEAQHGKIDITATDLEVGMKSSYQATVTAEGKITVSAKKTVRNSERTSGSGNILFHQGK